MYNNNPADEQARRGNDLFLLSFFFFFSRFEVVPICYNVAGVMVLLMLKLCIGAICICIWVCVPPQLAASRRILELERSGMVLLCWSWCVCVCVRERERERERERWACIRYGI